MLNVFWEIIEVLGYTIFKFGSMFVKMFIDISGIPTSQYGLVKYICENNLIILNSKFLTNVILFIVPIIGSHVVVYLLTMAHIKSVKVKEGLSIVLYLLFLYLFSSLVFWIILGVVLLLVVAFFIISGRQKQFI
jgi:hypothetical protein